MYRRLVLVTTLAAAVLIAGCGSPGTGANETETTIGDGMTETEMQTTEEEVVETTTEVMEETTTEEGMTETTTEEDVETTIEEGMTETTTTDG